MRSNRHHIWWPRKDYQTGVEKRFRGLPCNVIHMDFEAHKLLHAMTHPPQKPPVKEMKLAIQRHKYRDCACY